MLVKIADCYIDSDAVRAITPGAGTTVKIFFKGLPNHIIVKEDIDEVALLLDTTHPNW